MGGICRGIATSRQTRQAQHLHGLLPPAQGDLDTEIERAKAALELRSSELEKYQVRSILFEASPQHPLSFPITVSSI